MKTQNLRLNGQPLANYVCTVQFPWQALEIKNKTSPKQYLHILEHSKSFLEKAQEIPVELWYTFSQPPVQFPGEKETKTKCKFTTLRF